MYSRAILSDYLWVPSEEVTDLSLLKRRLTLTPRFDNLAPISAYAERDGYFGFPRHARIEIKQIKDRTALGQPISMQFTGTLREQQLPVLAEFNDAVYEGNSDLILDAPPGFGKTVVLLKLLSLLGRTALIVVPKSDLIEQWEERINEFTNYGPWDLGIAQGRDNCVYEGRPIVLGMLQSIWKDMYSDEFKRYFGVVVFDEIHRMGAQHFSNAISQFPARYRLGASATLKRSDGMERLIQAHLGTRILGSGKAEQPKPNVACINFSKPSGKVPYWAKDKIIRRAKILSYLSRNKERNAVILEKAYELVCSDRQTLVLSDRVMHLKTLKKDFAEKFGYDTTKLGLYVGSTSPEERKRIQKECDVIFATTGMLGLGTDIPTLKGLVITMPIANPEQAVGRIRRICPGTKCPVVVDIYDSAYSETINWFEKRKDYYEKNNFKVVMVPC